MIQRKQQQSPPSDDSGFTIIESLVAILVVGILLTAIAPVIFLATATRVQSRRVELATQAAKTYIEGIRTGSITTPSTVTPTFSVSSEASPRNVDTNPDDYLINQTNMPVPTSATGLYCFKKDGTISASDCTDNLFYIQAGRISVNVATTETAKLLEGYRLGIRVYRSDVDFAQDLTASTGDNKNTQRAVSGGIGDRQAPLIEMTTDITSTNRFTPTTFTALCQRLGVATNKNCD